MIDVAALEAEYRRAVTQFLTVRVGEQERLARLRVEKAWREWNDAKERAIAGASS